MEIRVVRLKVVLAGLAVTCMALFVLFLIWDPRMRRELDWEIYAIVIAVAILGAIVTVFGILDFGKRLETKSWVEDTAEEARHFKDSDSFD